MIGIHILENILPNLNTPLADFFFNFANNYAAATVFMFLMGAGTAYTTHGSSRDLANRGILLLTYGWVLNFFRYFLPDVIAYCIAGGQHYLNHMPMFFTSDIMSLPGWLFLRLPFSEKQGFLL